MISVCIPYYDGMENGAFFLKRAIDSVTSQTFKDYEIVLTNEGSMPVNTNAAIKRAKGRIIKILYQDDYLAHKNALFMIEDNFDWDKGWLVTACEHDDGVNRGNKHYPEWNDEIKNGKNTIGSPSVLAFENNNPDLFDENLSWTLDCELYTRLYARYGKPVILNDINVVIGLHDGQTTHLLSDKQKSDEVNYLVNKHV